MNNKCDLAYIAAFFDGEGYATIRRCNKRVAKNPSYRLVVGFTNKDIDVLMWIKSLYGGNVNTKKRRTINHAQAWELTIHNRISVEMILRDIQPYIRIKQKQISLGLSFLALGLVRKVGIWPKFSAVEGEIEKRENLKLELGKLNLRGPKCLQEVLNKGV